MSLNLFKNDSLLILYILNLDFHEVSGLEYYGLWHSWDYVKLLSSLLYCQFFHMYSTYIQRIEIALLSDPWCIQLTLNTDSRRSNTDKYSLTICTYKLYRYIVCMYKYSRNIYSLYSLFYY